MEAILRLELLISVLEARIKEMKHNLSKKPFADKFGRGHYSGYVAATELDIDLIRPILEELREEVAEEPFNSYDEKVAS